MTHNNLRKQNIINRAKGGGKEFTMVIFKPEAVSQKICGRMLNRFENKGFKTIGCIYGKGSRESFKKHYRSLKDCKRFDTIIDYMTSGPCYFYIFRKINAVADARKIVSHYRRKYPTDNRIKNVIHGSSSERSAIREMKLWFDQDFCHNVLERGKRTYPIEKFKSHHI